MDVGLPADLKTRTRVQHQALEDQLKLPQRIVSRQELCAVLAAWHPLERDLVTARGWAEAGLDPHPGAAARLLRDDLDALEHVYLQRSRDQRSLRPSAPPPEPAADFVIPGNAIGGRVLAPAVERSLGSGIAATRFFRRDGLDPHQDRRTFRSAMTSRAWSRDETDQATVPARTTFEFHRRGDPGVPHAGDAGP